MGKGISSFLHWRNGARSHVESFTTEFLHLGAGGLCQFLSKCLFLGGSLRNYETPLRNSVYQTDDYKINLVCLKKYLTSGGGCDIIGAMQLSLIVSTYFFLRTTKSPVWLLLSGAFCVWFG